MTWKTLALGLLAGALIAVPAPADDAKPADAKPADAQKETAKSPDAKEAKAEEKSGPKTPEGTILADVAKAFTWRQIGPANMAGRVTSLAVHPKDATNYFVGTAGGGLLKTVNNGTTFDIVFDDQSSVSIGDVAVAPSDPKIVWVGSGEANPRNSVQYGDGAYKSTDGGKTFTNMGLKSTYQIGKVLIHPTNPDIVYVGALGRLYGPSPDRGLFKTTDGGKTWEKVLYVDDKTGVIDARLDPQDPNTLIVAMWERKRDEHDGFFDDAPVPDTYGPVVTHGAGGGIYKSADAGKSWKKLTDEKAKSGLPTVKLGRIGLDYSAKTKGLLVAIIDTEKVGTGEASKVYLGVIGVDAENEGGAKLSEITSDGPADKAGLKPGDLVVKAGDDAVKRYDELLDAIYAREPGDKLKLTVKRGDKTEVVEVTLGKRETATPPETAGGRKGGNRGGKGAKEPEAKGEEPAKKDEPAPKPEEPKKPAGPPPTLGLRFAAGRLEVIGLAKGGPAEAAGVRDGDVLVLVGDKKVDDAENLKAALGEHKPGDKVRVVVSRNNFERTYTVTLGQPAAAAKGEEKKPEEKQVDVPKTEVKKPEEKKADAPPEGSKKEGPKQEEPAPKKKGRLPATAKQPRTPQNPPKDTTTGELVPLPGFTPTLSAGEVKVAALPDDGPVSKAGVKVNDTVTKVNGEEVANLRAFFTALRVGPRAAENPRKAGDKVKVTFKLADGSEKELELALVDTPMPGLGGAGGPARGPTNTRPFGLGLGGQSANVQRRQGKDGYQTGGVFVSKDNGDTWSRVNSLNPRPMYFGVIRIDPTDDNTMYVLADVPVLYKSTDGGRRFEGVRTSNGVHADGHALYVDPANPKHLVVGCDGGFYVSYDAAATWDHLNTLALGAFYHVATDNRRPYRVYGGLQDNGSWGGPSQTMRRYGQVNEDWVYVSGGDGFVCRVDPTDPDLVYAESQNGFMSRRNFRTGEFASIRPPRTQNEEALRFNWNTPFILSSHNPSIFYCGAQFVFRSIEKGANLKKISPDLTASKKGSLTQVAESPRNADVLWAGSDDGKVWVTRDGGLKWVDVTANFQAAGLPGPRWVNCVEPSRDKDGTCYVVFDGHRSDDDKPYVFVTTDFGATWKSLNANLPATGGSRVLREDAANNDVLYLGTEFGAWVSTNRGKQWERLGSNLPTVRVDEFAQPTTANDLVVATHGRSIWVTDVTSLRQIKPSVLKADATLFAPSTAIRWRLGAGGESPYSSTDRKYVGTNPPRGATLEYLLGKDAKKVSLKVIDATGKAVKTFDKPKAEKGLHSVNWDLATPRTGGGGGGGGGGRGQRGGSSAVPPGTYKVVLTVDDKEFTQALVVELDPNAPKDVVSIEGFEADDKAYQKERRAEQRPALPVIDQ